MASVSEPTAGTRDPASAMQWLEKAAARGLPNAKLILGLALADGAAGEPDSERAQQLVTEAAESGLDRAVLAGLDLVRVIHGVGKGVLRAAVTESLRHHPHVAESRLGGHGEGGRGVTIVRLR